MGRNADVADLSFCLRFKQGLIKTRTVTGSVALGCHMQLVDIDIVRLKKTQGSLQILSQVFAGLCPALGGDKDLVAHAFKGDTDFLAVSKKRMPPS